MRSTVRSTAFKIAQRVPMPVRRLVGPAFNALLDKALRQPAIKLPGNGAYHVRPRQRLTENGPRILHAIGNFMVGGSSRLVVDLYEGLGHRYVQQVVTQYVPPEPAYLGIPVTEIRSRASHEPMLALLREFKPDLVHVHYWGDIDAPWYETVFAAAREAGCRIVENVNTPVQPHTCGEVVEYVYVSDYVRRTFPVPAASTQRTIYPGSDFGLFRTPLIARRGKGRVGMVYRLEPDKLNAEAIEPLIAAARRDPELRFVVVGGGTFFEEYRSRVRAAGCEARFEFPGYVPYEQLPAYYRDLAVFVAPVWKESFGQVSSFAMNMGIPVVGYEVGAIGEIVDDATLVAAPGDSETLGEIIVELMHDPVRRRVVGARNRRRAQGLFSLEAMISQYHRLYEDHLK